MIEKLETPKRNLTLIHKRNAVDVYSYQTCVLKLREGVCYELDHFFSQTTLRHKNEAKHLLAVSSCRVRKVDMTKFATL